MPGSDFGDDHRWLRLGEILPEQVRPHDYGDDAASLPAPPIHQRPAGLTQGEATNPGTPKAKRGEAPTAAERDQHCGISRADLFGCTLAILLVEIILHVLGR